MASTDSKQNKTIQHHQNYPPGDNDVIDKLFRAYFKEFYRWCNKYKFPLSDEEINIIYTDAVLLFRDKAWNGQLTDYEGCTEKTVLFAFAKRLMKKHFATNHKEQEKLETYCREIGDPQKEARLNIEDIVDKKFNARSKDQWPALDLREHREFQEIFGKLPETCKNILVYCCAYDLPTNEVIQKLGYRDQNSLKTQKYKCLQKVKNLLKQRRETKEKD